MARATTNGVCMVLSLSDLLSATKHPDDFTAHAVALNSDKQVGVDQRCRNSPAARRRARLLLTPVDADV